MRRMLIIVSLCAAYGNAAWARLGESEELCIQRYGRPVQSDTYGGSTMDLPDHRWVTKAEYMKDDILVRTYSVKGVTIAIIYESSRDVLSDARFDELVKANSEGKKWTSPVEPAIKIDGKENEQPKSKERYREDGGFATQFVLDGKIGVLFVQSPQADKASAAKSRSRYQMQTTPNKTKGF